MTLQSTAQVAGTDAEGRSENSQKSEDLLSHLTTLNWHENLTQPRGPGEPESFGTKQASPIGRVELVRPGQSARPTESEVQSFANPPSKVRQRMFTR